MSLAQWINTDQFREERQRLLDQQLEVERETLLVTKPSKAASATVFNRRWRNNE